MWPEVKEGLSWVVRQSAICGAIAACTGTSNLFGSMGFAIFVLYALRVLHLAPGRSASSSPPARSARSSARSSSTASRSGSASVRRSSRSAMLFSSATILVPLAPKSFPLPLLIASALHHPVRRSRLQHHAGEPAPGDHARTPPGTDERGDALDRLGHDPDRHARRRSARDRRSPPHGPLHRRDRRPRSSTLPLRRSSRPLREAMRRHRRPRSRHTDRRALP